MTRYDTMNSHPLDDILKSIPDPVPATPKSEAAKTIPEPPNEDDDGCPNCGFNGFWVDIYRKRIHCQVCEPIPDSGIVEQVIQPSDWMIGFDPAIPEMFYLSWEFVRSGGNRGQAFTKAIPEGQEPEEYARMIHPEWFLEFSECCDDQIPSSNNVAKAKLPQQGVEARSSAAGAEKPHRATSAANTPDAGRGNPVESRFPHKA